MRIRYGYRKKNNSLRTTEVITDGDGQIVVFPNEYRFGESELYIRKIGHTIMLTQESIIKHGISRAV